MCAEKQSKAHIETWPLELTIIESIIGGVMSIEPARYSELLSRQGRNEGKCKPALEPLGLQGKERFKSIAKEKL